MSKKIWRTDKRLQGVLHPENHDEVKVWVYNGSFRMTATRPETVRVRITKAKGDMYYGMILDQPGQVTAVNKGDEIAFKPLQNSYPVMLAPKYLQERESWQVHPCHQCGFEDLFDAPSDLIAEIFHTTAQQITMFSTICPLCGGVQAVQHKLAVATV